MRGSPCLVLCKQLPQQLMLSPDSLDCMLETEDIQETSALDQYHVRWAAMASWAVTVMCILFVSCSSAPAYPLYASAFIASSALCINLT